MSLQRQKEFHRNMKLETLLAEISQLLAPVEEELAAQHRMPRFPVLFVVGVPRCGSTLMMQWLARTNCFAYPTNLLSRFYAAPALGARIQKLLADPQYNFNNEILDFSQPFDFQSNLGKTRGAMAPNEFWYFWRRFIPNIEPRLLEDHELHQVQGVRFAAELAAIEAAFEKPLAMKALILELNLPFLSSLLEKAIFLYVKRHPFYNIQSLLEARMKYYGSLNQWYSIKPREFESLQKLDPISQVAGQVYYTTTAIETGLSQIDPVRTLSVQYEHFCAHPRTLFDKIIEKYASQGYPADWLEYASFESFENTNQVRLSLEMAEQIAHAYHQFSREEIHP
ncbi:MAG: sulfotransferase [Anaerolineales bacterium]|nr:sulfotransferase [Anaerolineales bacterium]